MNAFRTNFALRTVAVLMALFGWLVLSNHCALSEMLAGRAASAPSADGGCCHQNSAPRNDEKPRPPVPHGCCKTLKVAMPDGAKLPSAATAELTPVLVELFQMLSLVLDSENAAALSTGPVPDVPDFADLVLNRSLLSHAPPALA